MKMLKLFKISISIILALFILLAVDVFLELQSIRVTKYTIKIKNLPQNFDGFTILQLTDLHSKDFGKKQKKLLNFINKQTFDIVALTGDFVERRRPDVQPVKDLIMGLRGRDMYFVSGNHEWHGGYPEKQILLRNDVRIFENENIKLKRGNQHIWLLGVEDPYTGRDDLAKAQRGISDSRPKVLLAHAPSIFNKAVTDGIDVMMVGHTHGGQVRFPFIGAIWTPGGGFLPKYDYGSFSKNKTTMIINGGLGETLLPIRFSNKPEIVLIKLVK